MEKMVKHIARIDFEASSANDCKELANSYMQKSFLYHCVSVWLDRFRNDLFEGRLERIL